MTARRIRGKGIAPGMVRTTVWLDPANRVMLNQVAALRRTTFSSLIRLAVSRLCVDEVAQLAKEQAAQDAAVDPAGAAP